MERVHFQQEQMLPELKDLVQKGLFTQAEIKQVIKKRTQFESALIRRVPKKADFLRYAQYEMGLERLRRKRVERMNLPPSHSISDYALVRRQFQIFERALKRFRSDVGLWVQYVEVAKREGARALAGRILARAIHLHPTTPSLYILAASHESSTTTLFAPSTARVLLQRGLRMNGGSVEMWSAYVGMEMGFVEGMRRRWGVLGIGGTGRDGKDGRDNKDDNDKDEYADVGAEEDVDVTGEEEAGREAVMSGGIVKAAMSSAVKAVPRVEMVAALDGVVRTYPCPRELRVSLLDHLYALVDWRDGATVKMLATRLLRRVPGEGESAGWVGGEELVSAVEQASEVFVEAVQQGWVEEIGDVFGEWVRGLGEMDGYLREYLVGRMQGVSRAGVGAIDRSDLVAAV